MFTNSPSLTLAKKAYSLAPEMWQDVEGSGSNQEHGALLSRCCQAE